MAQLNINMTPDFETSLDRFMRLRGLHTKSEAVRLAIREGVERSLESVGQRSFRAWLGAATEAELNPEPRVASHDELWD